MGPVSSKAEINSWIRSAINVFNTTAQQCSGSENQNINITIESCGDISISGFDINQNQQLKTSCVQKGSINTSQQSNITQIFTQLAQAIGQNFDLNPGSVEASTIARSCVDLSESIINTITQTCNLSANQVVNFNVNNKTSSGCIPPDPSTGKHDYAGINIVGVNMSQGQDGQVICLMQNDIIQQQVATISNIFDQKAKAEKENAIFWIIIAIAILLGVVIGGAALAANAKGPIAYVLAVIVLIIFIAVVYFVLWLGNKYNWFHIWPFKKKQHKEKRATPYSLPDGWQLTSYRTMLAIPYKFVQQCDTASWPKIRALMFPDIPSSMDNLSAAKGVLTDATNMSYFPQGVTNNPSMPCPQCKCSCFNCKYANPTDPSQCDSKCLYGYCPGDDDSKYNPTTCVRN